jgi:hypothetical protein
MITDGRDIVPSLGYMADDAGALLVRSGLVSTTSLDDARSRVASSGGTVGEQLVTTGAIADDALTDFYRSRLLVPQVNPNTLARLPARVVAAIPSDMAIELRAIPVALDGENNLTVAMSDPSDRHAVDEIAFFTGSYVVRAVATQMQIAWCLAHYYGHVTPLGQRLLQASSDPAPAPAPARQAGPLPRAKGLTGKVEAMRHRAIAPIGPVGAAADAPRPRSGEIAVPAPPVPEPPVRAMSQPQIDSDGIPDRPRARSVSGEIRVPGRRAPSIRPPIPEAHGDDDDESGPVIIIEAGIAEPDEDPTGPRKLPARRRKAKTDPPELAARAGEVDIATGPFRSVDLEEPRIIIAEDIEAPPATMEVTETSGELRSIARRDDTDSPAPSIEVSDDISAGVVIHERLDHESQPILLSRRRASDPPATITSRAPSRDDDEPTGDVVVLDAKKPRAPRPEKRTQVGIGALPALTRSHRDTDAVPMSVDDLPTADNVSGDDDPTGVDLRAAPARPEDTTDETIPPPAPPRLDDTNPNIVAAPPGRARADSSPIAPPPPGAVRNGRDDDDDDADDLGPATSVMSALELDEAIPERSAEVVPAHLARRRFDYDALDDGWGPPGTTIPPPLLGAIPGTEDDAELGLIPMSSLDSAPLIVGPPSPPDELAAEISTPVRIVENATARLIALIRLLDHAHDRDDVIDVMIDHLAESHQRAGFFAIKAGELTVFSIEPRPATLPYATLRLDRPSTLQDVVGTRLPYRGPMLDEASRGFLAGVLGASPAEILLVPVAVRERVVGVLFGEHRVRHTYDDQLAMASRAAGMALERILKMKRT